MYSPYGKRLLDIFIGLGSLLIFSPLMLLTALAIRIADGSPVLFWQDRVGSRGKLFKVCKFRSLPVKTGDIPSSQASAIIPTRIGKIIRRTNIDELPQLLNIVKGDMSIVGPRPALPAQGHLLELRDMHGAVDCKPGLTGLAQVNSYDGMPETEKARWDGLYNAQIGLIEDLNIIMKTFRYLSRSPPVY